MFNVYSWSGGKDSTWMVERAITKGEQIDLVLNVDTTIEFDEMQDHKRLFREKHPELNIVELFPEHDFEYYMFEHVMSRSQRAGQKGYGWPNPNFIWCRRQLKLGVLDKYVMQKYGKEAIVHIGIAYDEIDRYDLDFMKVRKRYPLIEDRVTELEAIRGCHDMGYNWGGLYDKFFRVSCWCCPLQSIKELYMLYTFYPKLWEKMREYDSRQKARFRKDYTLQQLEDRFKGLVEIRGKMIGEYGNYGVLGDIK